MGYFYVALNIENRGVCLFDEGFSLKVYRLRGNSRAQSPKCSSGQIDLRDKSYEFVYKDVSSELMQ